jgi:hypothetical protein
MNWNKNCNSEKKSFRWNSKKRNRTEKSKICEWRKESKIYFDEEFSKEESRPSLVISNQNQYQFQFNEEQVEIQMILPLIYFNKNIIHIKKHQTFPRTSKKRSLTQER